MTTTMLHECSFPTPDGPIPNPRPCAECGATCAQAIADGAFKAAAGLVADAYPLPEARFLAGTGGGEYHAIDRDWFSGIRRTAGSRVTAAECGMQVLYAARYPVFGDETAGVIAPLCAVCAWIAAAELGTLDKQVQALLPVGNELRTLGRLIPGPLIAATAAGTLIDAAAAAGGDPIHGLALQMLAEITRHRPQILLPAECADGECEHRPDGRDQDDDWECAAPAATAVCRACSLFAGPWAGGWEGAAEITVPAPCAVLTALAEHAAGMLADAKAGRA